MKCLLVVFILGVAVLAAVQTAQNEDRSGGVVARRQQRRRPRRSPPVVPELGDDINALVAAYNDSYQAELTQVKDLLLAHLGQNQTATGRPEGQGPVSADDFEMGRLSKSAQRVAIQRVSEFLVNLTMDMRIGPPCCPDLPCCPEPYYDS